MAARQNELFAEKETSALKKLQAAAGLVERQPERLDWMYEQNSATLQPDDDARMNKSVEGQKDQDLVDMKKLSESTAGSLFLKSATKTTEDMLRKLREDPLFQIRRQEQQARESMMANPLVMAKLKKKTEKQAKKEEKKAKKAAKKEKKALKKAKKSEKKANKKAKGSDSSSTDDSSPSIPPAALASRRDPRDIDRGLKREASPPPKRRGDDLDLSKLGPSGIVISKREEHERQIAERRDAALASRGVGRRLTEEEKQARVDQMRVDAARHEALKDKRIAIAEVRDKAIEEMEGKLRQTSDQKYFREMRAQAYVDTEATVADRLKSQKHRRQKNINDPLERDG